jgi:hypothetical protein
VTLRGAASASGRPARATPAQGARPAAAFRSDRAKEAALTATGYKVLRFTWDIHDATILRRLNALLQN